MNVATERVRQEEFRPFLPTIVAGGSGPDGYFNGGVFGGGPDATRQLYGGRFDMTLAAVWTLNNFGAGNRALVHQRVAEQNTAAISFADVQDRVAEEVVQAHALVEAAATQVAETMAGVKEAAVTYAGNLRGISETRTAGDLRVLIIRPQEAVAALQQLNRAYGLYYAAIDRYNRAQFQLYRALGFPARNVICDRPLGTPEPVDTSRPSAMAPVCGHMLSRPCP